jgi:hypothetical protein
MSKKLEVGENKAPGVEAKTAEPIPENPLDLAPTTKPRSRPKGVMSAQQYIVGTQGRAKVLMGAFLTHVKEQHRTGKKFRRSGTKAEWDAEFNQFKTRPVKN